MPLILIMIYLLNCTLHTIQPDLFQLLWLEVHQLKEQRVNVKELNHRILKRLKQNQMLLKYSCLDIESTEGLYLVIPTALVGTIKDGEKNRKRNRTLGFCNNGNKRTNEVFWATQGHIHQGRAVYRMGYPGLLSTWSLRYTPPPHLTLLLIWAPEVQVFFQTQTF